MKALSRLLAWGPVFLLATAACAQGAPATNALESDVPIEVPSATTASIEPETVTPTASPELLPAGLPDPEGYEWVAVSSDFLKPVLVTHAGDGSGRMFVVGQRGQIWLLENGNTLAEPFLDIVAQVGSEGNEQGLLGLAFHPDYAQNGYFYVKYTDLTGDTVVSRFRVSPDPNLADVESEQIVLQMEQPNRNHNGGNLVFGPDGYLYIGTGDGGSQGDPNGNGQSLDTLLGKILRIDVNAGSPYGIPADNPFADGGGLGEIWVYGLRNPWRFNFDSATGDLYIGDVGQNKWEEIDFLPSGTAAGANLGWSFFEGSQAFQGSPPEGAVIIPPVAEYSHDDGCSVIGGYVYRGETLPEWQGVYIYADYCSGKIYGLVQIAGGNWEAALLYNTQFSISSFGLDEAGELYVIDRTSGIYQLQSR